MFEFRAQIHIDAAPQAVWDVLVDAKAYPEFDPFCEKIEGDIALGQKIKAFTKLNPGRAFPVKVTTFDVGEKMVWSGGMPLGLFKGERNFTLNPGANGGTDFAMVEVFSGLMSGMMKSQIPDLTESFEAFAKGLKARVEGV